MPATSEHTFFPGDCGSGGAQYLQEMWNPLPSRPLLDVKWDCKDRKGYCVPQETIEFEVRRDF